MHIDLPIWDGLVLNWQIGLWLAYLLRIGGGVKLIASGMPSHRWDGLNRPPSRPVVGPCIKLVPLLNGVVLRWHRLARPMSIHDDARSSDANPVWMLIWAVKWRHVCWLGVRMLWDWMLIGRVLWWVPIRGLVWDRFGEFACIGIGLTYEDWHWTGQSSSEETSNRSL